MQTLSDAVVEAGLTLVASVDFVARKASND